MVLTGKGQELLITGISRLQRINKSWAKNFLTDMVEAVGMTIILGPQITEIANDKLTGFVVLAESHAAFHWVKPTLYLDIFSCQLFDVEPIVLWVTQEWQIEEGYYQLLERGWDPKLNSEVKINRMPTLSKVFTYT